MSTALASPPLELGELGYRVGLLRAAARNALCAGCRSADRRDCAPERPCCDGCSHTLPADQVITLVDQIAAAIDAARVPTGGEVR